MKRLVGRSFLAALFVGLLTSPLFSQPSQDNGNAWFERCRTDTLPCTIYISGLLEGMTIQADLSQQKAQLCISPGMSRKQLSDIVLAYLQNNPGQRHLPFPALVVLALAPHLPC